MRSRRSVGAPPSKPCPLERYLQFVSGAWAARILWRLRFGACRFGELRRNLQGISPKVLTSKLRMLEREGIVQRVVLTTSPPQVEYKLTALGKEFDPIFRAMEKVSERLKRLSVQSKA